MSSKWMVALCSVVAGIIVFVCADAGGGRTRYFECEVINRHYQAAWVQTQFHTDDEGHVSIQTIHHPEEFHVICIELGGTEIFDILTTRTTYHTVTNDQPVTVQTRQGRWTGVQYIPRITL